MRVNLCKEILFESQKKRINGESSERNSGKNFRLATNLNEYGNRQLLFIRPIHSIQHSMEWV